MAEKTGGFVILEERTSVVISDMVRKSYDQGFLDGAKAMNKYLTSKKRRVKKR